MSPRESQPEPRRRRALVRRFFWLGLVLPLALLEIGLQIADPPRLRGRIDPLARELDSARIQPHPYLGYALKPGFASGSGARRQIRHNRLGFRGPETTWHKPAGLYRIVCLGGSSTYGHGPSSNAHTWPARLQHHLREAWPERAIEVINAGTEGYSTFESTINLALRVVDLSPDLVIVYHTINDVRCALYPEPRNDNTHWRAVWPADRPSAIEGVLERSWVYRLARASVTDYVARYSELGHYVIVDYDGKRDTLRDQPSDQGFRSFARNLGHIVSLARDNGAEVLLVTQALHRRDLDRAPSGPAQLAAVDRLSASIAATAAARETRFLDAAAVLEAEAARQLEEAGTQRIFKWEVHLRDEGADLLARTIAPTVFSVPGR